MKQCFKCLCVKPRVDFYAHKAMGDGLLGKCKECTKIDATAHRNGNLDTVKAYDRLRSAMPHRVSGRAQYRKTAAYAGSHEAAVLRWAAKFPERRTANYLVGSAIRDGRITKWPACALPECNDRPESHHADYSRPLDVVWLCDTHHKQAHALGRQLARQTIPF